MDVDDGPPTPSTGERAIRDDPAVVGIGEHVDDVPQGGEDHTSDSDMDHQAPQQYHQAITHEHILGDPDSHDGPIRSLDDIMSGPDTLQHSMDQYGTPDVPMGPPEAIEPGTDPVWHSALLT